MGLKRIIKGEIIITVSAVIFIVMGFIAFSYALFLDSDSGETNTVTFGDIELQFCSDVSCTDPTAPIDTLLGTSTIGGITTPIKIYPIKQSTALAKDPFTFNIKNTGDYGVYVSLYLEENNIFSENSSYNTYQNTINNHSSEIKVAFGEVSAGTPTILPYSTIIANQNKVVDKMYIDANEVKTYSMWAWVDENASNTIQGTYFIVGIRATAEMIPSTISGT